MELPRSWGRSLDFARDDDASKSCFPVDNWPFPLENLLKNWAVMHIAKNCRKCWCNLLLVVV